MYPYYRSHYGPMNALADIWGAYTAKKQEQEEASNLASIYDQPEVNTNATVSTPQFGDMSLQTAINNKPNNPMQAAGQSLVPNTFGPQQQNTFTPGGIMDSLQKNYFPKDTQPVQAAGSQGGILNSLNIQQQKPLHQATASQPWSDSLNTETRVRSAFDSEWAKRMKHIAETTPELLRDKDTMKQIFDARMAARTELMNDWKNTETSHNWDLFQQAKTPQEKLFFAVKNGLDPNGVKMLMSPEWDSSLVNFGGEKRLIGKNKYTGDVIDMVTKNPITQDYLVNTMNPAQQAQNELGWANHDENVRHNQASESISASRAAGSASRSNSGGAGNPAETQRKSAMAIVQAHNAWVKNSFGADESDDPNYDTVQQAYKVLASGLSGGGSSSGSDKYGDYTGNDPVMQTIEKAINAHVSGDEIRAKLREKGYGSQYDDAIPD